MDTNGLIRALNADAGRPVPQFSITWPVSAVLAMLIAAVAFFILLGPRPDITEAAGTLRFLFKFVDTIVLAAGALILAATLSRPGERLTGTALWLAAAPAMLALAVAVELLTVPFDQWAARSIGSNSLVCLTFIPLIGIGPLAVLVTTLRYGAPTRPGLAGAVAGLAAGGIAATFYAAQCTDDSPLFVAVWYPIAILVLAAVGFVAGRLLIRW
jgi:hypothetical protein